MSIVFLFDENPDVASAGSGGAAVGGARSVPDHAARSNSERAAPSARVGNRFSAPQIVWNRSNRCAGGAWRGAGGQAQMGEDFDNHRRIFDACPEPRRRGGDDLQAAAAVRAVFDVDVEDPFEWPDAPGGPYPLWLTLPFPNNQFAYGIGVHLTTCNAEIDSVCQDLSGDGDSHIHTEIRYRERGIRGAGHPADVVAMGWAPWWRCAIALIGSPGDTFSVHASLTMGLKSHACLWQ